MLSKLSFFHLHAALDQVHTQDGGDDRNDDLKNLLNLWPFHNLAFLIRVNPF